MKLGASELGEEALETCELEFDIHVKAWDVFAPRARALKIPNTNTNPSCGGCSVSLATARFLTGTLYCNACNRRRGVPNYATLTDKSDNERLDKGPNFN